MKNFMKLLSLLLCFELIIGPLNLSLITSELAEAQTQTCPTGQTFNTSVNRCLTSAEVIRVNNATQSCGQDQTCYRNNAEAELSKVGESAGTHNSSFFKDDKGNTKGWTKALNAAAIAVPLLILIKAMVHSAKLKKQNPGFSCRPASLMLMYGAAAVLGTGEVITYFTHKSALNRMENRWKDLVVPDANAGADDKKTQATEAQSEAFEYLAQNEDSVAKTAKTKFGFYVSATSLFAAGALMSGVEIVQLAIAKKNGNQTEISRLTCGSQLSNGNQIFDKVIPPGELDNFRNLVDNHNCTARDKKLGLCGSVTNSKNIDIEKAKIIAAKNIASAKSVEDLVQLTQEFQSVEFENYSKISYFEDQDLEAFKKVKIDQSVASIFSELFIGQAHAGPAANANGGEKGQVATNTLSQGGGLLGGLKRIFGGVKSKNGVPLDMNQLRNIENEMNNKFSKFVFSPWTRFAINGVFGTWMGIMSHHMKEQQKKSEERAKKLREIKANFESANGIMNCKSEDRDDPSKPKCYCFTPENTPNPARSASKICATNFATLDTKTGGDITTLKTCVDQNYNLDPKCNCKTKKSSQGNGCIKSTSGINLKGFNPGTFKMLSTGAGPGNDILNGDIAGGSLDTASVGSNAAKIRAAADALVNKTDPKLAKQVKDMGASIEKSLMASGSGLTMPGLASAQGLPPNPREAMKELEKELKEETAPEVTKSGEDMATTPSSVGEEQPEFGLTEDQQAAQESEIAEVMSQEMDMGNNDINSGENTNLFDVLSNRYKRSGMRRLFDEEGKTKADAPSNSDIAP